MAEFAYITLRDAPLLKNTAAEWFHSKWGVPADAYLELMEKYLRGETEYGWEFLCMVHGNGGPGMTRMYVHR